MMDYEFRDRERDWEWERTKKIKQKIVKKILNSHGGWGGQVGSGQAVFPDTGTSCDEGGSIGMGPRVTVMSWVPYCAPR